MSMHELLETAVHPTFNMISGSWHMRVANEGKKMRQRIAQEGASGTNVSMCVPPCSFFACLRLTVATLLEKGGVLMFPATRGA